MATLYIMCGPPGAGKTTWARDFSFLSEDGWIEHISRDEIRRQLIKEDESLFSKEPEVFQKFCKKISNELSYDISVVADASHVTYSSRMALIEALKYYNAKYDKIIFIVMNTPYKECVERDNKRTGREHVGAEEIWEYYKVFTIPRKEDYPKCKEIWIIQ